MSQLPKLADNNCMNRPSLLRTSPMCKLFGAVFAGAANAGIPLSIIVKNYGWTHYFCALLISCGMAILLLAPMVNLKSYVQREAARQKKLA